MNVISRHLEVWLALLDLGVRVDLLLPVREIGVSQVPDFIVDIEGINSYFYLIKYGVVVQNFRLQNTRS